VAIHPISGVTALFVVTSAMSRVALAHDAFVMLEYFPAFSPPSNRRRAFLQHAQ
jgi:hypothetical protein